jgi:hypothetical protein
MFRLTQRWFYILLERQPDVVLVTAVLHTAGRKTGCGSSYRRKVSQIWFYALTVGTAEGCGSTYRRRHCRIWFYLPLGRPLGARVACGNRPDPCHVIIYTNIIGTRLRVS